VWIATTIAHVATTTAAAITVKSGIANDFPDLAMAIPSSPTTVNRIHREMCSRRDRFESACRKWLRQRTRAPRPITPLCPKSQLSSYFGSTVPSWRTNEGDWTMSNMTKIALFAAIMFSTAFSALTAANAAYREGASGTGMACYDRDGGVISCNVR
jgi:hypothetical protein